MEVSGSIKWPACPKCEHVMSQEGIKWVCRDCGYDWREGEQGPVPVSVPLTYNE